MCVARYVQQVSQQFQRFVSSDGFPTDILHSGHVESLLHVQNTKHGGVQKRLVTAESVRRRPASRTRWKLLDLFLPGPLLSLRAKLQHPHQSDDARQAEAEDRHQKDEHDARQADVQVRDDDVHQA